MTLVSMPQWPAISVDEYPEGMPPELVALLPSLHAACVMVTSAVYEHELYLAFGRDQSFIQKVNGTDVAPAIGLLRTCISDSLILTLASLFKSDPKAGQPAPNSEQAVRPALHGFLRHTTPAIASIAKHRMSTRAPGANAPSTESRTSAELYTAT